MGGDDHLCEKEELRRGGRGGGVPTQLLVSNIVSWGELCFGIGEQLRVLPATSGTAATGGSTGEGGERRPKPDGGRDAP